MPHIHKLTMVSLNILHQKKLKPIQQNRYKQIEIHLKPSILDLKVSLVKIQGYIKLTEQKAGMLLRSKLKYR